MGFNSVFKGLKVISNLQFSVNTTYIPTVESSWSTISS